MESVPSGITIPIEFNTQYGTRIVAIPYDWLTGTCVANCITDCGFNKDESFIYSVPVMVDDSIIEWIKEYLATRPSCFTFKVHIDEPHGIHASCDTTFSYIDTRVLVKCDFYSMNSNQELCTSIINILGATEFTQVFTMLKALDFLGMDPIVTVIGWRYQYYGSESNDLTTPDVPKHSTPKRKHRCIYGSKKYEQAPLDQYYEDMEPENPHPFDEEKARSGAEMQRMYYEFMTMAVADDM